MSVVLVSIKGKIDWESLSSFKVQGICSPKQVRNDREGRNS